MSQPALNSQKAPRCGFLTLALGLALGAGAVRGAEPDPYGPVRALGSDLAGERRAAADALLAGRDESLIPGIVDALFFIPGPARAEALEVLAAWTGERRAGYYEWIEYVGRRIDLRPRSGYQAFKVELLARIDERYREILYPKAPVRIRLEEVVSGGVKLAGIPAIVDPRVVPAGEAGYLEGEERVFGVWVNGEARAYPLRFLSWHELVNDAVGGESIALSYCTLCGSGVLYATRNASGRGRYTLGTSGLLYRSNKLMFDAETLTLWSNLTGEPVAGRLALTNARLRMLPVALTTWGEWRRRHPDTTVIDKKALEEAFAGYRFDYRPGTADRARAGVAFPVWLKDPRLPPGAEVYGLRLGGAAKAYPLERLAAQPVVNDELGGTPVVLLTDPLGAAVRAYRRGEHRFTAALAADELVDETGKRWRLTEDALEPVPVAPGAAPLQSAGDALPEPLPRLAGHVAFWFGWYGFFPNTALYGEGPAGGG